MDFKHNFMILKKVLFCATWDLTLWTPLVCAIFLKLPQVLIQGLTLWTLSLIIYWVSKKEELSFDFYAS